MLLEHLLQMFLHEKQRTICDLVRKQLSFLLSLVNDVMDLKIIEEFGHVSKKLEKFKPTSLFNFILDIFEAQVKMQRCYFGIEYISAHHMKNYKPIEANESNLTYQKLPDILIGD